MQQGNTKERIVEAYIELESERPVEKITVTALVERSRITRKTFYYYFKDIYDLMEYRMEREMKRIMEETMSQPDPEKALTQLYMYIMENQKHIRALSGVGTVHGAAPSDGRKRCTSIFITIWSGLVCLRT
ncbi:MAG: TetR/AcrR family transcriptional regulator [Clostridium fessum]